MNVLMEEQEPELAATAIAEEEDEERAEHAALTGVRSERDKINIQRKILNEADFEESFQPVHSTIKSNWYTALIPPEPLKSALLPPRSIAACRNFILTHLPVLNWLWSYVPQYIVGDLTAGFTVAIIRIPQGLAYSQLSGLPPVYGLYAGFVPVIMYSIFGSSRHVSVGTFAVVSLMVFNAITNVFQSDPILQHCLNSSDLASVPELNSTCGDIKVEIATTLAFISGLIMIIMGIFQLGFITIFLSEPLVSGYTTGAAVHVFTSQLKHVFGLQISIRGLFSVPKIWIEALSQIFQWPQYVNTATVIISALSIITLIALQVVDRKLLRKLKVPVWFYSKTSGKCEYKKIQWPVPLPTQLIVVIVAAGISYGVDLNSRYGVDTINDIPLGLPPITTPKGHIILSILVDALVIAVVTFSVGVSLARVFSKKFGYSISPTQELIAYGIMNLTGSLFGSINTSGSLSRTSVQAVSGGKTQMVGFISSCLMIIVLLALGSLFEPLPNAVLAAIIWVALYGMFTQVLDIWRLFKLSLPDMVIWLVVFLATVLLGVDLGLGVGVAFSLIVILLKVILPKSSILGRAPNTEIYRDIDNFHMVKSIPGVVIYRFLAPLCSINCKVFVTRVELACDIDRATIEQGPEGIGNSLVKRCKKTKVNSSSDLNMASDSQRVSRSRSLDIALQNDIIDSIPKIRTLILDCSPIGFMDAMGVKTLQELVIDFNGLGIQVLFAALIKNNRDMLQRVGFFDKCGKEWLFPSVQDAVKHALSRSKLHPVEETEALEADNETTV